MFVKTIETDTVVIPDDALELSSVYLHEYVDCDRVRNLTDMACVFGLRRLAGTLNDQNARRKRDITPQGVDINVTRSQYNPVPTDHRCKCLPLIECNYLLLYWKFPMMHIQHPVTN